MAGLYRTETEMSLGLTVEGLSATSAVMETHAASQAIAAVGCVKILCASLATTG